MNRIRKNIDSNYEVLITPHRNFDSTFEYLITFWRDHHFSSFSVKEFSDINDAYNLAYNQPELDWKYMISLQKGAYEKYYEILHTMMNKLDIIHDFKAKLLNENEAKDCMFDKILNKESDFRLIYDFSNLITFKIINPFYLNLKEIKRYLTNNPYLNLIKTYEKDKIIYFIGETDNGFTYTIMLIPTLINHWIEWAQLNKKKIPLKDIDSSLDDVLKNQKKLDNSLILR